MDSSTFLSNYQHVFVDKEDSRCRVEGDLEKPLRHWFEQERLDNRTFLSFSAWSFPQNPPFDYLPPYANASSVGELAIASMRKLSTPALSFFRWRSFVLNTDRVVQRAPPVVIPHKSLPSRHLAQVRTEPLSEVWFTSSSPKRSPADDLLGSPGNGGDHKPPDERTLRLGKSKWSF